MVPIISGQTPKPKVLEFRLSKVGFPIRKSADQSFLAAPHGLSQRSTSFIASQRQGIHQTPLRHLIALIINTHRDHPSGLFIQRNPTRITADRHCIRKTSLLRDRSDGVRSSPPTRLRVTSSWSTTRNPRRASMGTRVSKVDARIDLLFTMSNN